MCVPLQFDYMILFFKYIRWLNNAALNPPRYLLKLHILSQSSNSKHNSIESSKESCINTRKKPRESLLLFNDLKIGLTKKSTHITIGLYELYDNSRFLPLLQHTRPDFTFYSCEKSTKHSGCHIINVNTRFRSVYFLYKKKSIHSERIYRT